MNKYDCIVIGAGPAGISACIYLQRSKLKVLLIERSTPGGRMLQASEISNYAGMNDSGINIATKMFEMLDLSKIDFVIEDVLNVKKDNEILVETNLNTYVCDKLIVATGFVNKTLPNTNETEFVGRGVSYCALCDAPLVKNKEILAYANSKKSIDEITYLSTLAKKVYLITNNSSVDVENIEVINNAVIKRFNGTFRLNSVTIEKENQEIDLPASMAFIFNGYQPGTSFLKSLEVTNNFGLIDVDQNYETKVKNIYAIGDVNNRKIKQVATAVGDGAYVASLIIK